jgi:hypothetical protein
MKMKLTSRSVRIAAIALGMSALEAGAKTKFHSAWKSPDVATFNFKGQKVVAVVVTPNQEAAREAEGLLARELTKRGVVGIPAYDLLPPKEPRTKEKAQAVFSERGVVAAVVMRAGAGAQTGTYATSGGLWVTNGGFGVYDPGYLRHETKVLVETLVYELKGDKPVWVGISETTNAKNIDALVKNLVSGVASQMKKQGLIR